MNNYSLLSLSEIGDINNEFNNKDNLDFCFQNKSDIKLIQSLNCIDNNLNIIPWSKVPSHKSLNLEKKNKNSRIRQLKINEASKRTRLTKKLHMKHMSNHIKKIHELITKYNITNKEIIDEVYNFDKSILI
jgi:hypothetical protein